MEEDQSLMVMKLRINMWFLDTGITKSSNDKRKAAGSCKFINDCWSIHIAIDATKGMAGSMQSKVEQYRGCILDFKRTLLRCYCDTILYILYIYYI